jgi:hypothetical protein
MLLLHLPLTYLTTSFTEAQSQPRLLGSASLLPICPTCAVEEWKLTPAHSVPFYPSVVEMVVFWCLVLQSSKVVLTLGLGIT